MGKSISKLAEILLGQRDGIKVNDAIMKLRRYAEKGEEAAKQALAAGIKEAKAGHLRESSCSALAEVVSPQDGDLADLFGEMLTDDDCRYWAILGLAKTAGHEAFDALLGVAQQIEFSVEDRAHAIMRLSLLSNQGFDRGLPSDPGDWELEDLRLSELSKWAEDGFPVASSAKLERAKLERDSALDSPSSKIERLASKLDRKLAKYRDRSEDPSALENVLVIADESDLEFISIRWEVPEVYLEFLRRFSPVKVSIRKRIFPNGGLRLYGAAELDEAQHGYAYNPMTQAVIDSWDEDHLVIASHAGDPFVLDLSGERENTAVLCAKHGRATWKFERFADSFEKFLELLAK